MFNIESVFSKLLFSTVRIECELANGSISTGTAFFFTYKLDENRHLPLLVTNKHVVADARIGEFHLHQTVTTSAGEITTAPGSFTVTLSGFEQRWFSHPDVNVDLCVMPFEPLRQQAESQGKVVFSCPLSEELIPDQKALDSLSALEDVVMVGYPIGLWDSTNNLPLLRRGVTASHPASNFQGKEQGVVDRACFPGSSGSPILIMNEGGYGTAQGFSVGSRIHFLGVLYAGPVHRADGKIEVVEIPTHTVAIHRTTIPIHLGYYVKVSALKSLKPILLKAWNL